MALLSLGLHRYEPLNSKCDLSLADTPKPDEQRAPEPGEAQNPSEVKAGGAIALESGSGIVIGSGGQKGEAGGDRTGKSSAPDDAAAQVSAEPSAHEGVSQDWSEKGVEIIRAALRDAETRESRSAGPMTSETSPNGRREIPEARESETADFSAAIEELQRQIASGMAENDAVAPETREKEPPLSKSVEANVSTATLSSSVISAAWEIPGRLAAETSAADTKPASEIPPGPTWMAKLASGLDNVPSTMQTEFRSLAIDDLLRKLEANEGVEGLAKCGVPSQSEAGQDRVHTPSISARSDPARKELSQSPANQGQAGELFGKNQLPQSPAVILATVQAPSEQEWAPKFGYLPSPKFFYSLIGDAVLLVGLFLLLTYGCPRS